MKKIESIKKWITNIRIYFKIDSNIKKILIKENLGKIVEIGKKSENKIIEAYKSCPVEYCTRESITTKVDITTSTGKKLTIIEQFIGLNFESTCDLYILKIQDTETEEILVTKTEEKYAKTIDVQ